MIKNGSVFSIIIVVNKTSAAVNNNLRDILSFQDA